MPESPEQQLATHVLTIEEEWTGCADPECCGPSYTASCSCGGWTDWGHPDDLRDWHAEHAQEATNAA